MGAIADRLNLAVAGQTEREAVRTYLRVNTPSGEGTVVAMEFLGLGDGEQAEFSLAHHPVIEGNLNVQVGDEPAAASDYSPDYTAGTITFRPAEGDDPGAIPGAALPILASYRWTNSPPAPSVDDAVIDLLIGAAKEAADSYCSNPFEARRQIIRLASVEIGDRLGVSGYAFTAAAETSIIEREFEVSETDAETASELAACINDSIYGAVGVLAAADGDTITLTARVGQGVKVTASSSDSTRLLCALQYQQDPIPSPVAIGVLRHIARQYEQRVAGVTSESETGVGSVTYDGQYIPTEWQPYRLCPGF